jgi:RHS repeat-associated protein
MTTQTGAASTSSYKYTGREDDGSGLLYYRARYYHPRLQRFISEDPIEFRGGINLYRYVSNNPIKWKDSNGTGQIGTAAAVVCGVYDIYDIAQTTKGLRDLANKINVLNDQIKSLEAKCSSGRGSDDDVERLRQLRLEALQEISAFDRAQILAYLPNVALGFLCTAFALAPF